MDADTLRHHRYMALVIGVVFGFVFGLTSVGAGAFFGMALVTLFPLSARRVVGTDLFHGALVTCAAAAASFFLLPSMRFSSIALPDDRLDPGHPDRLAAHGRAAREGAARLAGKRARALQPEDARRVLDPRADRIFPIPACFPH